MPSQGKEHRVRLKSLQGNVLIKWLDLCGSSHEYPRLCFVHFLSDLYSSIVYSHCLHLLVNCHPVISAMFKLANYSGVTDCMT